MTPTKTVFETDKGYLHRVIISTVSDCHSYDEFQIKLYKLYGIEVHERRKQISYLLPDHRKPVRGNHLELTLKKFLLNILSLNHP